MIPKFRAWHKNTKKMLRVIAINFDLNNITADIENRKIYKDIDFWWKETDIPFSEIILLLSTGLKDKNGVEIYEGDIVKGYVEYPGSGWFDTDEWEGEIMEEVKFREYGNEFTLDGYSIYELFGQLEVAGNVYENPELLEKLQG